MVDKWDPKSVSKLPRATSHRTHAFNFKCVSWDLSEEIAEEEYIKKFFTYLLSHPNLQAEELLEDECQCKIAFDLDKKHDGESIGKTELINVLTTLSVQISEVTEIPANEIKFAIFENDLFHGKYHVVCTHIATRYSSSYTTLQKNCSRKIEKDFPHLNIEVDGSCLTSSLGRLRMIHQIKPGKHIDSGIYNYYGLYTHKQLEFSTVEPLVQMKMASLRYVNLCDFDWMTESTALTESHGNEKTNVVDRCLNYLSEMNKSCGIQNLQNRQMTFGEDDVKPVELHAFSVALEETMTEELKYQNSFENLVRGIVIAHNKHFAQIVNTGRIIRRDYDINNNIVPYEMETVVFEKAYKIVIPIKKGSVCTTKTWLSHPARRSYTKRVFNPYPENHKLGAKKHELNTYRGLRYNEQNCNDAYEDEEGRSLGNKIIQHMYNNICDGKNDRFVYLLCWIAGKYRRPWIKHEVAIVIIGHEGSGKGVFLSGLIELFGKYGCWEYSFDKTLETGFNVHYKDKLLVAVDELYNTGEKKQASRLRSLITENVISFEAKHKDRCNTNRNFIDFILVTNSVHAINAGPAARRFCVLHTKAYRRPNAAPENKRSREEYEKYYNDLWSCNDDDNLGWRAFAALLNDSDIISDKMLDDFGRGSKLPKSTMKFLAQQKKLTMGDVANWVQKCLERGYFYEPKLDYYLVEYSGKLPGVCVFAPQYNTGRRITIDYELDENGKHLWKNGHTWLRLQYTKLIYQAFQSETTNHINNARFWVLFYNIFDDAVKNEYNGKKCRMKICSSARRKRNQALGINENILNAPQAYVILETLNDMIEKFEETQGITIHNNIEFEQSEFNVDKYLNYFTRNVRRRVGGPHSGGEEPGIIQSGVERWWSQQDSDLEDSDLEDYPDIPLTPEDGDCVYSNGSMELNSQELVELGHTVDE